MTEKKISRKTYLDKNLGTFEEIVEFNSIKYEKVDDLRYGTNPHQPAAFYKPMDTNACVGNIKILKEAKNGLSQTNLEDVAYALNIVKFFDDPACAIMKHVNPCGVAIARNNDSIKDVYIKAKTCDPRAAFGSVVAFNVEVDAETATEIMSSFVECVVAPAVSPKALDIFIDSTKFKLNKNIRIIKCGPLNLLPRYVGEAEKLHNTVKVFGDGSMIIAEPLLTNVRSSKDLKIAEAESKTLGKQTSRLIPTKEQMQDLIAAWYVNLNVRSNAIVIMKNGQTLAIGTGEQDRVGAAEQAVWKFGKKYEGKETIHGSVMSSDGFFPFYDSVEIAAKAGVQAIISPGGSIKDAATIKRANELDVALVHAPERIFSHH